MFNIALCSQEVLALKAELVETQLTVDDLKQKLKAERKLSADQRAKLKENGMTMEELESQARNNAAQLLATIVEKDTLIQQVRSVACSSFCDKALSFYFGVTCSYCTDQHSIRAECRSTEYT